MTKAAILGTMLFAALPAALAAQGVPVPSVRIDVGAGAGESDLSTSLQLLALLTILSLAPAILILTTAFTRIVIVLSFVRTALGTQTIPPNQVVIGLSLFLTFFVMAPTYHEVHETALKPLLEKKPGVTFEVALKRAQGPIRDFMLRNTYEKDLKLFLNIRGEKAEKREDVSMMSLIPAFIVSELKTAFIIGFYIFIPFVIIDLVVASALMSMGMMMLPPVVVSLPAKLLVFVLADGWSVLIAALLAGYSP
jgi:flagellar biosynthetic protein FliP